MYEKDSDMCVGLVFRPCI